MIESMRIVMLIAALLLAAPAWAGTPQQDVNARVDALAETGWRLIRNGEYHQAAQTFA